MTAVLIVAIVGWLLAACMWVWACAEQDRAERATDFADDCLARVRGMRS